MAKVKHTKNELKGQRDALRRFERYLPTLQLKKQQLQIEVRQLDVRIREKATEETAARDGLAPWIALFSEDVDFGSFIRLKSVRKSEGNVAGVAIPVLDDLVLERLPVDLFETSAWLDDGIAVIEQLMRLRVERQILEEQQRRLAEELRVTSQRVNLFEKVKIPESRENIRVIRIFLGDQMTADVARGKIAKAKTVKKVQRS